MVGFARRDQAKVEATAEQRRREDAAPRLCDEVASLKTLRIHFEDKRDKGQVLAMSYAKPIVVQSAPATFEIRCMEPRCDGRHDLTRDVLRGLREGRATFAGRSECQGMIGEALGCDHVLAYTCEATYAKN